MMKLDNIDLIGAIQNLAILPSLQLPTLENTKVGQFTLFEEKLYFNSGQRIINLDVNELSVLSAFFGAIMNSNWTFNPSATSSWVFTRTDDLPTNVNDVFSDISVFLESQSSGIAQFDTNAPTNVLSVTHGIGRPYLPVTVIDRVTKLKLKDDEYTVVYNNSNALTVTTTTPRNFTVLVG